MAREVASKTYEPQATARQRQPSSLIIKQARKWRANVIGIRKMERGRTLALTVTGRVRLSVIVDGIRA
jgi:hypothetical protein